MQQQRCDVCGLAPEKCERRRQKYPWANRNHRMWEERSAEQRVKDEKALDEAQLPFDLVGFLTENPCPCGMSVADHIIGGPVNASDLFGFQETPLDRIRASRWSNQ